MFAFIIFLLAIGVYLYFYATRPAFKVWTDKVFIWLVGAAAVVGAAIAAWFDKLPDLWS